MSIVIAIDGPAASGKGTLARRLAERMDFAYLDCGLLFRAVGLAVVRAGGNPSDPAQAIQAAQTLDYASLTDHNNLRSMEAGQYALQCSLIPGVQTAVQDYIRRFASYPPNEKLGAVLDGRRIGTNICPNADIKFYMTASEDVRAARRYKELISRGTLTTYAIVLADMSNRDRQDRENPTLPMRPAADSIVLDTSALTPDEVFSTALNIITTNPEIGTIFNQVSMGKVGSFPLRPIKQMKLT